MEGLKVTFNNGNVKFIACYHYIRKGSELMILGDHNEIKIIQNVQEVKEI